MKQILGIFVMVFCGFIAVIATFVVCFFTSQLDGDRTVGGAYLALAALASPFTFVGGMYFGHLMCPDSGTPQ